MNIRKNWIIVFSLLALVSCKQESSKQPDKPLLHPLGDNTHVEVYDFIVDYVGESSERTREQALADKKLAEEIDREIAAGAVLKPPIVSAYETSMSNILNVFCQHFPKCRSLSLYDRSGRILAAAASKEAYPTDIKGRHRADIILSDDLYQQYQDGTLFGPHTNKNGHKTTYPIYLSAQGFATHSKPSDTNEPIGYIVYDIK